jgi:hypothetical protein
VSADTALLCAEPCGFPDDHATPLLGQKVADGKFVLAGSREHHAEVELTFEIGPISSTVSNNGPCD